MNVTISIETDGGELSEHHRTFTAGNQWNRAARFIQSIGNGLVNEWPAETDEPVPFVPAEPGRCQSTTVSPTSGLLVQCSRSAAHRGMHDGPDHSRDVPFRVAWSDEPKPVECGHMNYSSGRLARCIMPAGHDADHAAGIGTGAVTWPR